MRIQEKIDKILLDIYSDVKFSNVAFTSTKNLYKNAKKNYTTNNYK